MTFHLRKKVLLLTLLLYSTFNIRHLRTLPQVLATVIKLVWCSILHFQMYIRSLKREYKIL